MDSYLSQWHQCDSKRYELIRNLNSAFLFYCPRQYLLYYPHIFRSDTNTLTSYGINYSLRVSEAAGPKPIQHKFL